MEDKINSSQKNSGNKNFIYIDKKLKISHKLNLKVALFCFMFGSGYYYYNFYEKRRDLKMKFNKEINSELNRIIIQLGGK